MKIKFVVFEKIGLSSNRSAVPSIRGRSCEQSLITVPLQILPGFPTGFNVRLECYVMFAVVIFGLWAFPGKYRNPGCLSPSDCVSNPVQGHKSLQQVLPSDIGLKTPYEPSLWRSPPATGIWVGTRGVAEARRLTGSNRVVVILIY